MADSNLNVNINGRDNLSPVVNQLESKLIRFVGAVSSAVAAIRVATFPIAAAADFEREMANVKKTTEFSSFQVKELSEDLEKLSLRLNVSAVDLAKVAAAAGQQGLGTIGPEGIALFTESVSRMSSVLDITADEAANSVGKIMNIFKVSINDVERIASSFNEASNNSTASGTELLDVVRRIGDAAGTINLQESIGLSATGIDFGVSPEVVGTTYGKVFADMRAKAEDFAALMNTTASDWIKRIDTEGGIEVYKAYLARLRELNSADQAKVISELSGRGRIFQLVNKNVQDTQNNVLDRNLRMAAAGWDSGTSAIREQQTVLETLNEQYVILKNSIFSVSTEAGDKMLAPLTASVAQLSAALQTPAVKSFVQAIGQSMADLVASVVGVIKTMAAWNINWENLITVAKLFIGIKVAETIVGMIGRIGVLNSAYLNLTASMRAAALGAQAAGNAGAAGAASQTLGIRNIIGLWTARAAAIRAATVAEATHARAVANNAALESTLRNKAAADRAAQGVVNAAGLNRTNAAAGVGQARMSAQQMDIDVLNKQNGKLASLEQAHNAKVAAISAKYRGQRRVAEVAARNAELAAEQAHYTRSVASTNSYYSRAQAAARANGLQLIAQAEAEQARINQVYARAQAARLAASGQTARSRALLERSDAEVRRTAENLDRTRDAANRAGRSVSVLGTIVAGLGVALRFALSAFMSFFLVATLVYTLLDAFGMLDNVAGLFTKLGDAIGLTSEAKRKEAQKSKDLKEALAKEKEEVKELIDGYNKLKDASTGRLDATKMKDIAGSINSGGANSQQMGLSMLGKGLIAADKDAGGANEQMSSYTKRVKEASDELARMRDALAAAKKAQDTTLMSKDWRELAANVDKAKTQVAAAEKNLATLQKTSVTGMAAITEAATANQREIAGMVNTIFTKDSAELFQNHIVNISREQKALEELTKKRQEAAQAEMLVKDDPAKLAEAKKATAALDTELTALNSTIANMQKSFKNAMDAILGDTKIQDSVKNSVAFLSRFLELRNNVVEAISGTLKTNVAAGQTLTGTNVPNRPAPDTGTDTPTDPKNGAKEESEARKLARARLQREKARAEAEQAIKREQSDQIGVIEDRAYADGLTRIDNYFAARQKRQLANNQAEIDAAKRQVKIAQVEQADRKAMGAKPSELTKYDADIDKLNGEIAVLRAKRNGIRNETQVDMGDAYEALKTKINATSVQLADSLGVTDVDTFFRQNLAEYGERYKTFYAQLTSEGTEEANALLGALQDAGQLEAVGAVMQAIAKDTERAYSEFDNYTSRLEMLRDASAITTAEFEVQAARARNALASRVQQQIDTDEATLARMTTAAQRSSDAYKNLAQSIDDSKLRLQQLQSTANQVAVDINNSIQSGIQQSLATLVGGPLTREITDAQSSVMRENESAVNRLRDNIAALERARSGATPGYSGENSALDSQIAKAKGEISALEAKTRDIQNQSSASFLETLKQAAGGFGLSLAQSIQGAATKQLSESAMGAIGNLMGGDTKGGGGGVGGFFADLLGGGKGERGSEKNPMIVKDASEVADPLKDITGKEGPVETLFDTFKNKTKDVLNSLSDGLGDTFSSLTSSLGDMLSGLFKGGGGGGGFGSILGSIFSSFHTGGVVGASMQPMFAHPAVFANAVRYHTGGIAGLAPDEVPAILRRGEEVLTAGDARHRNNAGGSEGSVNVSVVVNMETGETSVQSNDPNQMRQLGKTIASVVQQELMIQKRPGGLLSK